MLDTVTVPAGTAEFDLEADSATQQPVRVEKCWGNSAPLTVYTPDSMDADFNDNWMVNEGPPVGIVQLVANIVRLYPIPLLEVSLSVRISVCPAENATSFPNEFLRYREAIVAGALGVLYTYDKEVWANSSVWF